MSKIKAYKEDPKTKISKLPILSAWLILVGLVSSILFFWIYFVCLLLAFILGIVSIFKIRKGKHWIRAIRFAFVVTIVSAFFVSATIFNYIKYTAYFSKATLERISVSIESVMVYDLEGLKGHKYSQEDLDNTYKASYDANLFKDLLPKANYKYSSTLWEGSSLAVLKLKDGTEQRLALSYYGGFFSVLNKPGILYFEGSERKAWEKEHQRIIQEVFIPQRNELNKLGKLEGKNTL
jgi:hypothetical protein